jgi:hypothetical protein
MSIYNGISGKESNLEQSYVLLDLAGQVALRVGVSSLDVHQPMVMICLSHQIGFRTFLTDLINKMPFAIVNCGSLSPDIDPSMWGFAGREAYDRRVYFWSLMSGVLWQVCARPLQCTRFNLTGTFSIISRAWSPVDRRVC